MSNFTFSKTSFEGPRLIIPKTFNDNRGYFVETYHKGDFDEAGIKEVFVQDNTSFSHKNVIRGMHLQRFPHETSKLVRCIKGSILDVIVDVRPTSQTFGKYEMFELSEENLHVLYVPKGFAHGFCALTDAVISYKVSGLYNPSHEVCLRFNDPEIGIPWPVENPIVSEKDKSGESLKRLKSILLSNHE